MRGEGQEGEGRGRRGRGGAGEGRRGAGEGRRGTGEGRRGTGEGRRGTGEGRRGEDCTQYLITEMIHLNCDPNRPSPVACHTGIHWQLTVVHRRRQ